MKPNSIPAGFLLLICFSASSATRYVNVSNSNPAAPYTSWATAATTIQDAVDAAGSGETILVTNGVYATGGRAVHGTMTNRVAVDKPVHLLSVNGPQFTVIRGYQVPGTTNGDGAIRCVYLTNGASLSGFTLTNGATRATNDYVKFHESGGGGVHCEALQSYLDPPTVVSNCIITGNSAFGPGGGVYGGGVSSAQIIDCELRGNTAQFGGGVAEGWVTRCLIADNAAENGGGASEAYGEAGGFEYYSCKLDNCLLVGNRAQFNGGGAYACELNNCTVVGNSAGQAGGGLFGFFVIQVHAPSRAVNSVVYSNTAPSDANFVDYACNLDNSCTTPLPGWGSANITNAPSFVDFAGGNFRLQSDSPCINSGTNYYAPGPFDLDGNPRVRGGTVDMGAYEFQQGSTGLVHYVNLLNANPVSPYLSWATAATNIQDAIDAALPGEEIIVTNGVYATGGRVVYGALTNRVAVTKPLLLRSVNGPQFTIIEGHPRTSAITGDGAIRCVYLTNGASLVGFTLTNGAAHYPGGFRHETMGGGGVWCESEAAAISDCILTGNTAQFGGGAHGGSLSNCTLSGNSAAQGGGAYGDSQSPCTLNNCTVNANSGDTGGGVHGGTLTNCILSTNSAAWGGGAYEAQLTYCTLIGNQSGADGGGAYSGTLSRCVLTGNTAFGDGGGFCGDAHQSSWLNDCLFFGNSAAYSGGGVFVGWYDDAVLNNCTITGNSASNNSGGIHGGTLTNCIVYFNSAPTSPNWSVSQMDYCCTTPLALAYVGTNTWGTTNSNITDPPGFVNLASGDLRLQSNSPCINAGFNAAASTQTDLDRNPRIVSGTVDIGAYEFQGDGSMIFYAWLQRFGLPTDGSADSVDSDNDRMNNWQEWRTGTIPTNPASLLKLGEISSGAPGLSVAWQSVVTRSYFIERATNLTAMPPFSLLATNIPGLSGMTIFSDPSAVGNGPFFYRVGVEP